MAAEKLTNEYDALGRPIRLGGSMGQYVVATAWSAYGQLDQLALGNTYGTISWQSYKYAAGSGRLIEEQYDRQTRPELDQQLTYAYDLAGNTTSIRTDKQANGAADVLWQETECFSYDGLNRLKAAWSGNAQQCGVFPTSTEIPAGHGYASMFEFDDATFNRTKQTYRTNAGEAVASYTYPATATEGPVHAPSKVTITSTGTVDPGVAGTAGLYTYTAAGQMMTRPTPTTGDVADQALAWDAEHHLAGVDGADTEGDQAGFYETTGARVIRKVTTGTGETAETVTTAYLPGGLEVIHDTSKTGADQVTARRNYGFAGQTVATRTGNDPADVTTWGMDSQGTPEYGIANAENATLTGTTESSPRRRDRPFGGDRGTLPPEKDFPGDIGFVGSTRDEDAGILQVGARPYDPYLGLFLTTDPLVDLTSPGSLNAYGYANQNPVTNSDPSGLGPTCQLDPGGSGGSCNYSPATGEISNFTPSTAQAPPPPAPTPPAKPADPVSIPGKDFYYQPGVSNKELENYLDDEAGQSETGILLARNAFACAHPDTEVGRYCGESSMECTGLACGSTEGLEDVFVWYVGEPDELASAGTIFDLALSFSLLKIFRHIPKGAAKSGCAGGKCGLPGKTCFVAGTKIKTEHGLKAIEDVKVGDKVWAKNQTTGKDELREVDRTYVRQVEKLLHLTIAGSVITTTEDYPFWVEGKGWTRAGDMHVGDVLETPDGTVVLDEMVVEELKKPETVYNFRVAIDHNYYALAGETPVLVHNADYSFVPRTEKAGDLSKYTEGQKTRDAFSHYEFMDNDEFLASINGVGEGEGINITRGGTIVDGHHRGTS